MADSAVEYFDPDRFLLYKAYESGFNNDLMSLELAIGLAWSTGRRLVYYGTAGEDKRPHHCRGGRCNVIPPSRRHLIDNRHRPNVLDLVDPLPLPCQGHSNFLEIIGERKLERIDRPSHLHETVFCATGLPTSPEALARLAHFAEQRPTLVDPETEVFHFCRLNLGYYSRFFFDPPEGLRRILEGGEIAAAYREFAARVACSLGDFGANHVRLTDFRSFQPRKENDYRGEILKSVRAAFDPADLLVISTDESETKTFFSHLLSAFPRHVFLDEWIERKHAADFRQLPFIDETTFGLVCNLILRHARRFAGTPGSSFTTTGDRHYRNRTLECYG